MAAATGSSGPSQIGEPVQFRASTATSVAMRRASTATSVAMQNGFSHAMRQKTDTHVAWLANFHVAVALAFMVKGVAAVIMDYAPVVLPRDLAKLGTAVMYFTFAVGCFGVAGPVIQRLGCKRALVFSLSLLDVNYVLFCICAFIGPCNAQWPLFITGMLFEGLGASIGLTLVCLYMARTGAILAKESPGETESQITVNLGGSLGAWSLGTEVLFKLATSATQDMQVSMLVIMVAQTLVAVLCTALLGLTRDLPEAEEEDDEKAEKSVLGETRAFFALWLDPCIWLLGLTNFSFAFLDALMINYVNPEFLAPMLGDSSIGLCMAVASLSGALLSKPYGFLGACLGKVVPLALGALSFALVILIVRFTSLPTSGGWLILILYVLYGSGRAVVEGVNRAVFADFFVGPVLLNAAYANWNFQGSALEAASNFLLMVVSTDSLLTTALTLSVLTVPGYLVAQVLRAKRAGTKGALGDETNCDAESDDTA